MNLKSKKVIEAPRIKKGFKIYKCTRCGRLTTDNINDPTADNTDDVKHLCKQCSELINLAIKFNGVAI